MIPSMSESQSWPPYIPPQPPPPPPRGVTAQGEYTGPALALVSVLSLLSMLACPVLVAGIVLSCMGLNRVKGGHRDGAGFMLASWILLGLGGAFGALVLLAIALG